MERSQAGRGIRPRRRAVGERSGLSLHIDAFLERQLATRSQRRSRRRGIYRLLTGRHRLPCCEADGANSVVT